MSSEQKRGLWISGAVVAAGWLFEIVTAALRGDAGTNFFFPQVNLRTNLPLTAVYLTGVSVFTLAISFWLLRQTGEWLPDLGFIREGMGRQLMTGAGFGLGVFVFNSFLLLPALSALMPGDKVTNRELFSSGLNVGLMLYLSLFKGGFVEEFWRIFVLTRFEKLGGRAGLVGALIISSALFGLGHAYQGKSAIIGTAIIGFLNALIFLRKRRMLEAVGAHATFDVVGVVLGAIIYGG